VVLSKVTLGTPIILTKENCGLIDNWWQNVIDENGNFDKTKDRTFLKKFKIEYPKQYKELSKIIDVQDVENS